MPPGHKLINWFPEFRILISRNFFKNFRMGKQSGMDINMKEVAVINQIVNELGPIISESEVKNNKSPTLDNPRNCIFFTFF